jgi:branched-chain amino acid transport system ATP-binding protein
MSAARVPGGPGGADAPGSPGGSAAAGEPLLAVRGLHAHYGDSHVLQGVDLTVGAGEAVALVGRNGAGKTTTVRSLMGLAPPSARFQGGARFAGRDLASLTVNQRARCGLGLVPEDRRIFPDLTVAENLEVALQAAGRGGGAAGDSLALVYDLFPALQRLRERRGGRLSGGEQQMLTVARTLMTGPRLLLLDEPSEGLAPIVVSQLLAQMKRLKATGISMLVCEQNFHFVREMCDRAYVLEVGVIRYEGAVADLERDAALWRPFVGL